MSNPNNYSKRENLAEHCPAVRREGITTASFHEWRLIDSEITGTVGAGGHVYSRFYCIFCRKIVYDVEDY